MKPLCQLCSFPRMCLHVCFGAKGELLTDHERLRSNIFPIIIYFKIFYDLQHMFTDIISDGPHNNSVKWDRYSGNRHYS